MQQDKLPGVSIFYNTLCHSDERFLRGLPISRPNREESEIAQARPERRVYIGADERFLRGLPISRAIAEESEIAQARPKPKSL